MSTTIYYNPRCSKCRIGIKALEEYTQDFKVVEYLEEDEKFTEASLQEVLNKLNMKPMDIIRTHESEYQEWIENKNLSDKELISIMVKHPKLIQRPIVVKDEQAVLARPAENLSNLF